MSEPAHMPIEFYCPYCTAAIEVDASAAGKMGRCPRCGTKVQVPRPPGQPVPPTAPEQDSVILTSFTGTPSLPVTGTDPTPMPVVGELPDPAIIAARASGRLTNLRRPQRPRRNWVIPTVVGVAIAGVAAWLAVITIDWQPLEGTITGEAFEMLDLPPVRIVCNSAPLTAAQRQAVLDRLKEEPLPLVSDFMEVEFRGTAQGLAISIAPGEATRWYRVDLRRHPAMNAYLSKNLARLDAARKAKVERASEDFLSTMHLVHTQDEPLSSAANFRDQLALPALVGGVGHHVAAAVDQRLYNCVRETDDGLLYFLLPPDVRRFEVVGRTLSDSRLTFPGHFVVEVPAGTAAKPQAVKRAEPEQPPAETKSETDAAPAENPAPADE